MPPGGTACNTACALSGTECGAVAAAPPAGSLVVWDGLTFTVKVSDDRRVSKVEIARKPAAGTAATGPQHHAPEKAALQSAPPPDKVH